MDDVSTYDVERIIYHEFVHQWHGNLVTCVWWNEMWLNEGMTSYFESFGMLALYPQELVAQTRMLDRTYRAFEMDPFVLLPLVEEEDFNATSGFFSSQFVYNRGASIT